ncbi:hypothetical protein M3936_08785 [Sutcliffiella horikoshii]|uniref:hypothetical protein n=1 Tax=Sutcliffiella horikoshii TaxID=79883 RepID=UPI00203A8F14|nr:hypothetical protein [Sutcliffiella horikoshii]MCM3617675.1 hypothetical protein [Sutcliffiella horikoshii]
MFIVVIIILLLVVSILITGFTLYNKWIKMLVILYYIVITTIFIDGYHHIHEKYNMYDGPVIPEGWEVNSNWAFLFSFAYIIPIGILLLYGLIQKLKPLKLNKSRIVFVVAILISIVIMFVLFVIFNIAYGLRP